MPSSQPQSSKLQKPDTNSITPDGVSISGELTIDDLRLMLADAARRLTSGEMTAAMANAVANLTGKVMGTYKIQMEYSKMVGQTPQIKALLPPQKSP